MSYFYLAILSSHTWYRTSDVRRLCSITWQQTVSLKNYFTCDSTRITKVYQSTIYWNFLQCCHQPKGRLRCHYLKQCSTIITFSTKWTHIYSFPPRRSSAWYMDHCVLLILKAWRVYIFGRVIYTNLQNWLCNLNLYISPFQCTPQLLWKLPLKKIHALFVIGNSHFGDHYIVTNKID